MSEKMRLEHQTNVCSFSGVMKETIRTKSFAKINKINLIKVTYTGIIPCTVALIYSFIMSPLEHTLLFYASKKFWEACMYSIRTVRPSVHQCVHPASQIWCVDASWGGGVSRTIFITINFKMMPVQENK